MRDLVAAMVIVACSATCVTAQPVTFDTDSALADLVSAVNARREANGLQPVVVDVERCEVLSRVLPGFADDPDAGFFEGATGLKVLGRYITDVRKACFIVTARDRRSLLKAMESTEGFIDSALDPKATHIAASIGDRPSGGAWCALCITEKLLHFGACYGEMSPGFCGSSGYAAITWTGTSSYHQLRAEYYKAGASPTDPDVEIYSETTQTDESGAFSLTLQFGYPKGPGPGEYTIDIYVREDEDSEYVLANRTRFVFPKS